jgi:N-acyl-L-homoserine lactone synthetase
LGIVCGFELGGEWIGTIRIVPLGHGLTLTETLMPHAGDVPPIEAGDWEVGRLVLAPAYRTDVEALRHCLRVALEYGFEHSEISHLYATCTHVLSRLYRRFGFSEVARNVPLPGTEKLYTLIRGSAAAVASGLSGRPAAAQQTQ